MEPGYLEDEAVAPTQRCQDEADLQQLCSHRAWESKVSCDPLHPTAERRSELCPRQGLRRIMSRQTYSIHVFVGPPVQHTASPGMAEDVALWPRPAIFVTHCTSLRTSLAPTPQAPGVGSPGKRHGLPVLLCRSACTAAPPLSLTGDSHDN